MTYQPRHALIRAVQRLSWRTRVLAFSGLALAAGLGGMTLAGGASAASTLSVTLSACGTNASAVWNSSGNPVLTPGTSATPTGTCGAPAGSTYNPTYAQIVVNGVAGASVPAPADEPVFMTDHYAAGSPRWVIELHNGHSLWGYPSQVSASGVTLDAKGMAWAVDNGNTYESYSAAYNDSGAASTTVDAAYVVADASQAGTSDTITGLSYGSDSLPSGADSVTVTAPANFTATEGTAITPVHVQAASSKGDGIASFSASGLPAGLAISNSGVISGTVSTGASVGSYPVTVSATDNGGTKGTSSSFTITVKGATVTAPDVVTVTSPGSQSSTVGTAIAPVDLVASSSKGDAISSWSASGLPGGLTLNTSTGVITGTPTTTGSPSVTVIATDSAGTTGSATFTWTVQAQKSTSPTYSDVVTIKNRLSGKCLNEGNGVLSQFSCSAASSYPSLRWQVETINGVHYLISAAKGEGNAAGMFVRDSTEGAQLTLTTTPSAIGLVNGGLFRFPNGLVMDDKGQSRVNFAPTIGWVLNGGNNQRWDFQFFASA